MTLISDNTKTTAVSLNFGAVIKAAKKSAKPKDDDDDLDDDDDAPTM